MKQARNMYAFRVLDRMAQANANGVVVISIVCLGVYIMCLGIFLKRKVVTYYWRARP
jgi:hypothetical protein